jgi:hypothetical protein
VRRPFASLRRGHQYHPSVARARLLGHHAHLRGGRPENEGESTRALRGAASCRCLVVSYVWLRVCHFEMIEIITLMRRILNGIWRAALIDEYMQMRTVSTVRGPNPRIHTVITTAWT